MARKLTPSRSNDAMSLEKVLALFVAHCRSRNLSVQTCAWYQKRMGHFIAWFTEENGRAPALADFTSANFQLFILEKQSQGVYRNHRFHNPQDRPPSSSYIHGYFRVVRAFGVFLEQQELVPDNPMRKLQLPKLDEKQLVPLTPDEEKRLLGAYNENSATGCRTKAMFMLMLDAGLRRAEIVDLRYDNVFLEEGYLLVKGKGKKERLIPFGYKTGWVLQRYAMLYRQPALPTVSNFFLDPKGYPMTLDAVKMVFARAAKRTGISRLHPHLLRHTFGMRSQELSIPSLTLQRLMGHADVRTTERYAHAHQSEAIARNRNYSHLDLIDIKVSKPAKGKKTT